MWQMAVMAVTFVVRLLSGADRIARDAATHVDSTPLGSSRALRCGVHGQRVQGKSRLTSESELDLSLPPRILSVLRRGSASARR
ncbi:hypothetical protein PR003_g20560 [Phytophthora rubi]|uniref:RxLR effector protein n=1 Tax=Phytophthora rubi TaxID=129364 RepID=A0A6A3LJH1_9STRA|nr:hypothetical protein PR001_g19898 [Phytophthora rubi]KAE9018415.1 hypothetical protein PR002_g13105 [Phytophthora rubi]KAE9309221.1 hypothetical protein PR003_g20560 [Phytophthora rubi]